ncbi:MAG: MarR family transcriptional regulator [Ilumatobacteraceae bacterium]
MDTRSAPGSDPTTRRAERVAAIDTWRRLLVFQRRSMNELDDELRAERGLDLEEYDVLLHLTEAGRDGLRMGEIADRALLARSSCTRVVDRLERGGLVERAHEPQDRRMVRVLLTADGRAAQRRAAAVHVRGIERRFSSRLSPEDLVDLRRVLTRLEES